MTDPVAEERRALETAFQRLALAAIDYGGGGDYQRVGRAKEEVQRAGDEYAKAKALAAVEEYFLAITSSSKLDTLGVVHEARDYVRERLEKEVAHD